MTRRRYFFATLLTVVLLLSLSARSQRYQSESFNLREGLPQSQVFCLLEDHRGVLWAGTQGGGLARFNGQDFNVFNTSHGLPGNRINDLVELIDGQLLIATEKGLAAYDGMHITVLDSLFGSQPIFSLFADSSSIFVGGEGLLTRTRAGLRDPEVILEGEDIFDVLDGNDGFYYACGDKGLYRIDSGGQCALIPFRTTAYCNSMFYGADEKLRVCTYGHGVLICEGNQLIEDPSLSELPDVVFDAIVAADGSTFFATQKDGLFVREQGGQWQRYMRERGLPVNAIHCLSLDRWGNVWLGTSGGGLIRLSALPFTHYTAEDGLPGPQNYAIATTLDDDILIASGSSGIFRFAQGQFIHLDSFDSRRYKCIMRDSRGWIWAGSDGEGVFIDTGDTTFAIFGSDGLSSPFIRAFAESTTGDVWVATAGGGITRINAPITPLSEPSTTIYTSGNGLSEDRITDLVCDHLGRLWFATRGSGIGVILANGDIVNFTASDGLPSDEVRALAIGPGKQLWVALASGQLCHIDLKTTTYQIEELNIEGDRPYTLYAMAFDSRDRLWLGSANGVWQLIFDEEGTVIDTHKFDADEGFEGLEVCANAMLCDVNGKLWIGTVDGLSMHEPTAKSENGVAPVVHLVHPELDYQPMKDLPQRIFVGSWDTPLDTLVLTYEQNNLSFEIEALHLKYPDDLSYSHWLEGYQDDWSNFSERKQVTYGNLPPGEYTLHAKACVKGAVCADSPPLVIRILRPFWMTQWFFISVIVATIGLIGFIFLVVITSIKRRAKQRNERLELERDMLEMEQRALRLQMNPHFIFNTLNSIQGLIAREDNRNARLYLSRFSRLMREILENSREDHIPLEEELETLGRYAEMEQFVHEHCFEFEVSAAPELLHVHVPPLIIQPFVENSIIHGILPRGNGKINVHVSEEENETLIITVEDNGIGRQASAERNKDQSGHKSAGLAVTRERLEMLSPRLDGKHLILFEDIDDGQGNTGTRVIIRVPNVHE